MQGAFLAGELIGADHPAKWNPACSLNRYTVGEAVLATIFHRLGARVN